MRAFYIGAGLWICVGVVLVVWNMIVYAQMANNRVPKPGRQSFFRPRARSVFFTDASDYTELGRRYRRKAIWAQLAMAAYVPTLWALLAIAMSR
jgi:hypothetical protein